LKSFETAENSYSNIPCHVYLPLNGKHPPANIDYAISGTLSQKKERAFVLKPQKNKEWSGIANSPFNLSQWKYDAKKSFANYLKKEIQDPQARTFLTALATGDVDERLLSLEFGKVGLQHILAISGFHFALAAFFLNLIFRIFCSYRVSAVLL